VEGTEAGDTLVLDVLSIDTEERGIVLSVPGLGVLGDSVARSTTKIVSIGRHWVDFGSGLRVPKRAMIGVIGVAPEAGSIPTGTPGSHGGNMDTNQIRAGSTLYLPVRAAGALLALGDVHAAMGDGEICGTGVECAAEVTVRVGVRRDWPVEWPWLRTEDELMVLVSAQDLDAAAMGASRQMVQYLVCRHGYTFAQAYMLMSCAGALRISQAVDPLLTVRAVVPRRYLNH